MSNLKEKQIVVGITGCIAAYKSAELIREIIKSGGIPTVVMTENAMRFVAPLTFQTLSGNPVVTGLFQPLIEGKQKEKVVEHISIARKADLILIAPATANIIAKLAHGIADDMLSTLILATKAPVLIAPAMNAVMWENSVVQENIARLKKRGFYFIDPEEGELACGEEGKGRLAKIEDIIEITEDILEQNKDLVGRTVLVGAGPTQEFIDPVRYVTNRSSGKMGFAIAKVARRRGAKVVLISGPVSIPAPFGVNRIVVRTALEMKAAMIKYLSRADIVIMAAAVSDYRPVKKFNKKIRAKSAHLSIDFSPNPDILSELGKIKKKKILVGFAAETEDLINNATKKLNEKNLDLIVANDVSREGVGFDSDLNEVKFIDRRGSVEDLPVMSKMDVASHLFDKIIRIMH